MVMDWILMASVVALVVATYFVIGNFIDTLMEYWRAYRDKT